jgi:hypothetical protein
VRFDIGFAERLTHEDRIAAHHQHARAGHPRAREAGEERVEHRA